MKKILIVEDDNNINNLLNDLLETDYYVTQAFAGSEAKRLLVNEDFDLILLDLMLPGVSGEELITEIRSKKSTPIIVITAKNDPTVLSDVFDAGANDYIAKPFNTVEVTARIRNQLKSHVGEETESSLLTAGNIKLNDETHEVYYQDQLLSLTQKEYEILKCFLTHPKKVFTKANLYETIWQEPYFGDDNTITVHISRLRNKFQVFTDQEVIKTIWGVGFQLNTG
ncbi:MAG: response regulator transcription factor [Tetragenococcus koreensis]|uniref:response regulator transcription factor n=1 Tax=Tetragenococcus muriaticus TaxID=64642 RepID=UPI00041E8BD5|nr:response regulator transcription factor [Tetragenococcus muriaticus]MDN6139311.1 response regulator transcription factor [Tetragenococcus koreensis]MDN6182129.1 response regulator transcription factor [Staphylococcus equorum]MDN6183731.1 response regulator transcription factor [Lactococcus lactis]MDN6146126.1 response regulator transcription factor [Tetragenococcus koreensis]MDN6165625.1 response regulator transcription factor [Tetragenococcus koreensis]